MNNHPQLTVQELTVRLSGQTVLSNVCFTLEKGDQLAIAGGMASGKTTLLKALAGQLSFSGTVIFDPKPAKKVLIGQQHQFTNLSHLNSFYYQQRFNSADAEDALTVLQELEAKNFTEKQIDIALAKTGLSGRKYTHLIQLSNGEHKRFQLAEALLEGADYLLLDSPYTGLDSVARKMLDEILNSLAAAGVQIILMMSHGEVPSFIKKIAILEDGALSSEMSVAEYRQRRQAIAAPATVIHVSSLPAAYPYPDFSIAIKMMNTKVSYNNRTILDNINWEVKKGECWSISGHNGSGKSTLLSLVNGDNPQAFANEIYLFDQRKGSGESIWDIKRKIGYVSPELHHYFDAAVSCFDVVASGLFDTIGLFRKISAAHESLVNQWLDALQLTSLANRRFHQLSNGQQRMILLARALVKNPPLLILDEPCQGLDDAARQHFIQLVNTICVELKKTLVYVSHYSEEIPPCVTSSLQLVEGRMAA
jgi:molybdate transport system ATP-binding protein